MDKAVENTLKLAEKLQGNQSGVKKNPFADRLKTMMDEPER